MNTSTKSHQQDLPDIPPIDDAAASAHALSAKLADAQTPGYAPEFDPGEAERAGAFAETALSESDAAASAEDLAGLPQNNAPAFLDDDGPSPEIPPYISTANTHTLFGLKDGETVLEAMARNAQKAG